MKTRFLAPAAGLAACAMLLHVSIAGAGLLAPRDATYLKECGSCHMAYSPQLLPAASWKHVMGHLDDHFGDSANLDASTEEAVTRYLVENSAEHGRGDEAKMILSSIEPGTVPRRITDVPYISELHAAALDPSWNGKPRPTRLTECETCHVWASKGNYGMQAFSVTDEAFRGK
jgi:hypothetical protein